MKRLEQIAIHSFKEGQNCAQSVLTIYADLLGFNKNQALSLSSGFGAGMGRLQETCGAVTGAFMVIGLYNSKKHKDNASLKEASMNMIRKFEQDFKLANGTTSCKALINCDLNTEAGQTYYKENNLAETICEKCISNSITLINKLITD